MFMEDKKGTLGEPPYSLRNPPPAGMVQQPPESPASTSVETHDAKASSGAAAKACPALEHWAEGEDAKGCVKDSAGDKQKDNPSSQAKPGTPAAALASVKDTPTVRTSNMLHPEEIFRDVGENAVNKKRAFNRLDNAWEKQHQAEAALSAANAPKAKEAAQKSLETAKKDVAAATRQLKDFVISYLNLEIGSLGPRPDPTKLAALQGKIAELQVKPSEAPTKTGDDEKGAADPAPKSDSRFEPQVTTVTRHDFAFPDGQHVRMRDHVRAYSTSDSAGIDTETEQTSAERTKGREDVKNVMKNAGLSESKSKILGLITSFEGGFDNVNTYDRAKLTWGYMQWTGGSESDLTGALTVIKKSYPESFAKNLQAYGIDVVRNQLVVTPADGGPPLSGDKALEAILKDPRLAAVLSHAGRDGDIQKGEVKAAAHIEIDQALSLQISDGQHHKLSASQLISSEYGVGLLANTAVHSGSPTAQKIAQRALQNYVEKHPYKANDAAWAAGAEAAILPALAAVDRDRAAELKKQLHQDAGTFKK